MGNIDEIVDSIENEIENNIEVYKISTPQESSNDEQVMNYDDDLTFDEPTIENDYNPGKKPFERFLGKI